MISRGFGALGLKSVLERSRDSNRKCHSILGVAQLQNFVGVQRLWKLVLAAQLRAVFAHRAGVAWITDSLYAAGSLAIHDSWKTAALALNAELRVRGSSAARAVGAIC